MRKAKRLDKTALREAWRELAKEVGKVQAGAFVIEAAVRGTAEYGAAAVARRAADRAERDIEMALPENWAATAAEVQAECRKVAGWIRVELRRPARGWA